MLRRTKTLLPTSSQQLLPKLPTRVKENWDHRKEKYKLYYNRNTRELPELQINQKIWIKKHPQNRADVWVEGKVVSNEGYRQYVVDVEGRQFVRNRRFIRT